MDLLDDIKGDIKEGQYLELCKELKSLNINFSKVYKFTYFEQKKVYDTSQHLTDNVQYWKLVMTKKTEIVKIGKCNFHHQNDEEKFKEEVDRFIKNINELKYSVGNYYDNISIERENNEIPAIVPCNINLQGLRNRKLEEIKGDDYDSDDDDIYIQFIDIIPLHIEELN